MILNEMSNNYRYSNILVILVHLIKLIKTSENGDKQQCFFYKEYDEIGITEHKNDSRVAHRAL